MEQLLSFVCSPENDVIFLLLHHQSKLHLHTALYVHWSDMIRESAQIYEGLSPSLKNEKLRCTYRSLRCSCTGKTPPVQMVMPSRGAARRYNLYGRVFPVHEHQKTRLVSDLHTEESNLVVKSFKFYAME